MYYLPFGLAAGGLGGVADGAAGLAAGAAGFVGAFFSGTGPFVLGGRRAFSIWSTPSQMATASLSW